jgi:two-component system, response regulator YesN
MYKVVLIDDEPLVIEGLLSMINWSQHGFKISGYTYDGASGMKMIEEMEPDLVITDIRMPEIDGLTMIKQCQKRIKKPISFIVLSGYNDFDYIKEALDLKSLSYILKPIDEEEIYNELDKIRTFFEQQQIKTTRLQENIHLVTRMTVNRLVEEPYKETLYSRAKLMLEVKEGWGYSYGIIELYDIENNPMEELLAPLWKFAYKEEDIKKVKLLVLKQDLRALSFMVYGNKEDVNEMIDFLRSMYKRSDVNNLTDCIVTCLSEDLKSLRLLTEKVKNRRKESFYDKGRSDTVDLKDNEVISQNIALFDPNEIMETIKSQNSTEREFYLNNLIRTLRQAKLDPKLISLKFNLLIDLLNPEEGYKYELDMFSDFCEFKVKLIELVNSYIKSHPTQEFNVISEVRAYIECNYQRDMKLKKVAQQFGYNPMYFGQLFFKCCGIKYSDYLLNVRIQRSKSMLLYTDKTIKEIALSIGFNNPDYYVQKFKEIEGKSPSHYRI